MYLKRIEMSGFKSFADRTVIDFEEGLTAIVGPNGSGKSNITEAVRWVLGEQSAKNLRGDKMYDVIFSGTDKRHAVNVAEVTMVLDNSDHALPLDYSEVSVTRRLSRDGSSYYAINQKACRLKDIVDLFTDSGLGKNAFSIISQGKVEAIFNDKPENRRVLFEEAAGVLKYKQRKQQAEDKLDETQDNLDRLEDILYELEAQLAPLGEQKVIAEKFQTLNAELEQADVQWNVAMIEANKVKWDEYQQALEMKQAQLVQLEQNYAKDEQAVHQQETAVQQLAMKRDELQAKQLDVTERYEKQLATQQLLNERKQNRAQNVQEMKQAILEDEAQSLELVSKIAIEVEQKHVIQKALDDAVVKLRDIKKEMVQSEKNEALSQEEMQAQYFEYMQQQASVRNECQAMEREYQQAQSRKQRTDSEGLKLKQQLDSLESEVEALKVKQREANEAYKAKQQAVQQLETSVEQEQRQYHRKQEQVKEASALYQQALAKQKSLRALQQNYSGYYNGVKAVLKERHRLPGIVGAVAECLHVDERYATAFDVAVGSAMQHIIVEDEAAGKAGIQYLKQQRQGRATFLPLSVIKPYHLPENVKTTLQGQEGYVGVAMELATFDPKVANVMASLLGTTIIATTLDSANRLSRLVNYKYKVVSLEGDIIRPGGAMTGGQVKSGQNLFSQQNELAQLDQTIDAMKLKYEQQEAKLMQGQATIQAQQEALQQARQEETTLRIQCQNDQKELEVKQRDYDHCSKEYKALNFETSDALDFLEHYDKNYQSLQDREAWLGQELKALEQAMSDLSKSEQARQAQREQWLEAKSQAETDKTLQEERLKTCEVHLRDLEAQKQKIEQKITQRKQQLHLLEDDAAKEIDVVALAKQVEQLAQDKAQVECDLEEIKVQYTEEKQAMQQLEQHFHRVAEERTQTSGALETLKVKYAQVDQILDESLAYLQETYQLTYEAAVEAYPKAFTVSELESKVSRLKREIQTLGPVNMAAIEQYQSIKERYDFMIEQRDDLLTAKAQLLDTMSEMDQTVKARFKETFDAIAEAFSELFPKMFGGGQAALMLTDEDDLLHTGIDIEAQPPGKRLQSLSLLSGGERSLTAITLLFAMIQVKPVPFCILDEVEAALDEANVYRFGHYLRHFEQQTQFIVITHRKGTMEAADVLYGVTMKESGISSLVSVKMEALQEVLEEENGH